MEITALFYRFLLKKMDSWLAILFGVLISVVAAVVTNVGKEIIPWVLFQVQNIRVCVLRCSQFQFNINRIQLNYNVIVARGQLSSFTQCHVMCLVTYVFIPPVYIEQQCLSSSSMFLMTVTLACYTGTLNDIKYFTICGPCFFNVPLFL